MKISKMTLSNQLETLFIDAPESSAGSIQIWFRAGSALEKKDHFGIAHFLEHMFFKGTKQRPGPALTKEIESYGGEVNAFTSFDYTCYYINSPKNYIDKSVEILLDMVTNPEFNADELIPEREVVYEEYRRSVDAPNQFAFKQIQKSCFTKGYSHPILGNEKTIKNFHRDQLLHFRHQFYNLSNALLVVAGSLKNMKKTISLIEGFQLPQGNKSVFPRFDLKKEETVQVHKKEVRMMQLTVVIQAPSYLEDQASSEDLAVNCLGHGETSRLYKELIIDDATANSCSASTMFFASGGAHLLRITCPPENMLKIYDRVQKCLQKVMDEGFALKEIEKIKNQYVASKIYEKESIESLAFSLGHGFAQNGNIFCEDEFIERIKKTSIFSVNNSFKNILQRPFHLNLQIPLKESVTFHKEKLKEFQKKIGDIKKRGSKTLSTPKTTQTPFDPFLKLFSLKKGVKLLYRKNTLTPTFIFHGYIKGGISQENDLNTGIHHLVCATMTKGYGKIPYDQMRTSLEEKSAGLSGFSGKNTYGLTLHGQTEHTEELFAHFFGSLIRPDFVPKFVTNEKKMALRIIDNQKEDPAKQCFKEVGHLFFKDHPYAMDILGTPGTIKNLSPEKIRTYHHKNLNQNEILFTYCGNLEASQVLDLLSPYLDKLKPRSPKTPALHRQKPVFGKTIHIPFDREQTHIFVGIPSYKMGHERDIHLKILNTFLSGQSSELFVEMRDRQGLCYVVQPVHFSALEGGYWGIYMASGHDKAAKATLALRDLIGRLQRKGISRSDFQRIKKMIEGQNLINLQTNDDYADTYSIPELHGLGMNYFHRNNELIKKLPYEKFISFLSEFLKSEVNVITVGKQI